MDTTFGTWNVRSLHRAGSLTAAARELWEHNIVVDLQEVGVWGCGLDRAGSG